jgi:spore germination protein KB
MEVRSMAIKNSKEKISHFQLFSIIFLVPYGSAVLFFLIPEAKQDAWVAILFYILPALVLQHIYITLFNQYPKDSLVTYLPKIFGKFIGKLLSVIYILYFAYIAARVLRDFTSLIVISTMTQTPRILIGILLAVTVTYGVSRGFENLCRIISTFFPGMMIFLVVMLLLFYRTPNVVHYTNIYPIIGEGILPPVIKGWKLITFPYGETVIFTMIYAHVNEPRKIKRTAFTAVILQGIVLAILNVLFIMGLGVNYAQRQNFPLLDALRLIRISGFMDRLDILIIIVLIVDGFVKISFFMYVAIAGTAQIFKIKNINTLAWPCGVIVLIASMLIAKNFHQHLKIGLDFTPKYIHLPLQIVVPILALLVQYIRKSFEKKPIEGNKTPGKST